MAFWIQHYQQTIRHQRLPLVGFAVLCLSSLLFASPSDAATLRVTKAGVGSGVIATSDMRINCGSDCNESYTIFESATLLANPSAGSTFVRWWGDCSGTSPTCTVSMSSMRSVRAEFTTSTAIPTLTDFTPSGIASYLAANPTVDTPARFIKALPAEFKQNWILMTRSESLQTGTAESPRFLLPSANSQFVFTFGMQAHTSYPGAHPNAIEYMQWDPAEKNFRFHEIVLAATPPMGTVPARVRGVAADDMKCTRCHSTNNVPNNSSFPGTTGIPPGIVKAKNKPNWDTYDSWAGMMPFNRDRIYQGTVEAAAFRKLFNWWTWQTNDLMRPVIEQLELQPPGVPMPHAITRVNGGSNDGHVSFGFDGGAIVTTEPMPSGGSTTNISYSFNGVAGVPPGSAVVRDGNFVTLHHSSIPGSDEGRGVRFFDNLGGLVSSTRFNQQRVADELISHRFATGSYPIDVRPIALAITKNCLSIDTASNTVVGTSPLTINMSFFNSRNGMMINQLVDDTRARAQSMPRRKADLQKINLDRTNDVYTVAPTNGLIQQYGAATSDGTSTAVTRIRQDVFRRGLGGFNGDSTVMGGVYVDREIYAFNTERVALFRYFLEPLGVSVDKWSMGVRGRSRTYSFADIFGSYISTFDSDISASLTSNPIPGLAAPFDCASLIPAINSTLGSLPSANDVPRYTDVQRIFNRSCIECHGGLDYPPFSNYFPANYLDFSEDENLVMGDRLTRPYTYADDFVTTDPATSYLYQRITQTGEDCPFGLMPCGGPALSKVDTETIRRWITGGAPFSLGDPHIKTVSGVHYDFQAVGEFVLLRDPGMEIQVRQSPVQTDAPLGPDAHTGLTSCVSINTAAALRVGKHRISLQPSLYGEPNREGLDLYVDGKLVKLGSTPLVLPAGGRIMTTASQGGIQVEFPGGVSAIFTPGWWDYYQVWYLNVDVRNARANEGIAGAIAPQNWLPALPDNTWLGARPSSLSSRYKVLYDKFANAWRVTDKDTLFQYASGTSTKDFTLEAWPGFEPTSCELPKDWPGNPFKPTLKPLPIETAKKYCADVQDKKRNEFCVHDVMVTGEPTFANTYVENEKWLSNIKPTAPLLAYPGNNKTGLPADITFSWKPASDKDQDKLSYMHCVWAAGETPTFNHCVPAESGITRKLDSRKSYFWKVVVNDGRGGTTESETRRFATK